MRPSTFTDAILRFIVWLLRVFSLPAEVFIHTRFGVRYLTFPIFLVSFLVMLTYWVVLTLYESYIVKVLDAIVDLFGYEMVQGISDDVFWPWVFAIYGIVGLVRVIITQLQNFTGIKVHTRYSGSPFPMWFTLPFLKQEYTIKRFWEPGLVACVGWIVWALFYEDTVGWYIWICAGGMSLRNHMEYMMLRGRILDVVDSRINAEEMHEAIFVSKQPFQTRGAEIAGVVKPTASLEDRKTAAKLLWPGVVRGKEAARKKPRTSSPSAGLELAPDPARNPRRQR
jgi:hypothetical protein